MRLDGKLTARQLGKIASDKERRTPELLDAIMVHPFMYLTLFRWAIMYAPNEPDATNYLKFVLRILCKVKCSYPMMDYRVFR